MNLIDTHTHIDFFDDPEKTTKVYDNESILTVFMTYLPEIFEKHSNKNSFLKHIRLALGYHPSMVINYPFDKNKFDKLKDLTHYIGEVGLDFTVSKDQKIIDKQIDAFEHICKVTAKNKILSIHTKRTEKDVLEILKKNNVKHAIFHWYNGSLKTLNDIVSNGYLFSVNTQMLTSQKGKNILNKIPLSNILIESDGPFTKVNNKQFEPQYMKEVYKEFSSYYKVDNFQETVFNNFCALLRRRKLADANFKPSNVINICNGQKVSDTIYKKNIC